MDFISNRQLQITEMLKFLGIDKIEDLFGSIPKELQLPAPAFDDGLSEMEGMQWMEKLASRNTFSSFENYLGAGAYEHHVPALVQAICSKSEFLTSYTPYQAEASQGMLQIMFEFQSAICALTGMDVSNASVYDGASACAEAVLMALRLSPGKSKIVLSGALHPSYRKVVEQYAASHHVQIVTVPFNEEGALDLKTGGTLVDEHTAVVLLQTPNFFGVVENFPGFISQIKEKGALVILCMNPLAYGLFASAREQQADIAVGDCQPLGLPLQFGGPYAGYMACRHEFVRQMPGRIAGETTDAAGKRGFVLTLQAREQHIRREKATSNICTNQALAALASLVAMLWYGNKGLRQLAMTNFQRASYLKAKLSLLTHVKTYPVSCFNEFAVKFKKPLNVVMRAFREEGIEPGLELERFFPQLTNTLLVAVTETKSKTQLDKYIKLVEKIG